MMKAGWANKAHSLNETISIHMYIIRSSSSFNPKIVYEKKVLSAKNINFSFEVNYLNSFENKNKTILKKLFP